LESAQGEVKVSWHTDYTKGNNAKSFTLDVDIPEGGSAQVVLPFSGQCQNIGSGHHTLHDANSK
jgi:hypothetical protein